MAYQPAKQAVQFGAGNIGRGFIGIMLAQAGYQLTFVDVVEAVVTALNERGQYSVVEIDATGRRVVTVEAVRALDGRDEAAVTEAVSQADLVTTAVGPNVLRIIAPVIAKGLARRAEHGIETPLNIIACENLIDNSKILQEYVRSHLPADYHAYLERWVGFPRCVVDKVVTSPSEAERAQDPLLVIAEGQGLLIVDRTEFVGEPPLIAGMQPTDKLDAYVEKKIFTLNTAHAVTAYLAYARGIEFVHEALQQPDIRQTVQAVIDEVSAVLVKRHQLDPADQAAYAATVLQRFDNATIPDPVARVGREPKRKLAPNDRLIKPALLALELGLTPHALATGIAAALRYDNPDDEQARALQAELKAKGLAAVLAEVSDLPPDSPLIALVQAKLDKGD